MPSPTAAVLLLLLPSAALGHSFLGLPASRNLIAHAAGKEDCPHCLQSGGPDNVKERGGGVWPTRLAPGSHGLCGDPVQGQENPLRLADETYLKPGLVVATYEPGEIAEFHVVVSTHHQGHYEFRICDRALDGRNLASAAEGQACLDTWLLERAGPSEDCVVNDPRGDCQPLDPKHPERWYLPPAGSQTQTAGADFDDSMAPSYPVSSEVHIMRYKIPEGLHCTACTLQWYWSSGNSCLYDGDYFDYYVGIAELGWNVTAWQPQILEDWANCGNSCCKTGGAFGEEFWNCADIAVVSGGSGSSTTTAAVSTTTSSLAWVPVEGGEGRACRGASLSDNAASYYTVHSGVSTLDDCKTKCTAAATCKGIEYSQGGRCEVWTRSEGIQASAPVSSFTCLSYGPMISTTTIPSMGDFEAVDGGNGRACRGATPTDNSAGYFTAHFGVETLNDCKSKCIRASVCEGIEYSGSGRCEVWTRTEGIKASAPVAGYTCLRYGTLLTTTMPTMGSFEAVDGGDGRACRGATLNDNSASYFTAYFVVSTLDDCKIKCASTSGCVGIEYSSNGRCEVWTRAEGIQASKAVAGYVCLRYSDDVSTTPTTTLQTVTMPTSTTAAASCTKAWGACGGQNWDGPTCCVEGYQCFEESIWYSQCRPISSLLEQGPSHVRAKSSRRHSFLGTALLQDGAVLRSSEGGDEL